MTSARVWGSSSIVPRSGDRGFQADEILYIIHGSLSFSFTGAINRLPIVFVHVVIASLSYYFCVIYVAEAAYINCCGSSDCGFLIQKVLTYGSYHTEKKA